MALSKIQAESMNLADTFAFTGNVTGAGGATLSSVQTISSAVAQVDVTVPTSTKVITCSFHGLSMASSENLVIRVGTSGGIRTSGYTYSSGYVGARNTNNMYVGTPTFPIGQGFTATNNSMCGIFQIRYLNGQLYSFKSQADSVPYTALLLCAGAVDVGSVTDITTVRIMGGGGYNLDAGTFIYYFE